MILLRLLGLALGCGLGLYMIITGIAGIRDASQSPTWPTATAQVTEVNDHPSSNQTDYDITYTYRVGGQQYQSHTVYCGQVPLQGRYYSDTYPKDSTQTIHYSPGDPSHSCLVAGTQPRTWLRLVFGTIFLSIGVLLTVAGYLAPKYGKPDGRGGYLISFNNPLGKFGLCAFAAILAQFILLYFLDR